MFRLAVEQVPAGGEIPVDEMEVEPGHVDGRHEARRVEAHQMAVHVFEPAQFLVIRRFGQRAIVFGAGHGARQHRPEPAAHVEGREHVVRRQDGFQLRRKRFPRQRADDFFRQRRLELAHGGEGRFEVVAHRAGVAVEIELEVASVQRDQFAVEVVERADAEVALFAQRGDGDVVAVEPFQQGVDGAAHVQLGRHGAHSSGKSTRTTLRSASRR